MSEREPDDLLNDDGDLDGEVITATMTLETVERIRELQSEGDADPVHLARCAECEERVQYRSNVTGSGFFLIDADPDAVFGVGENGRPVCRNGHGEMSIADDKIPAADAFGEVAAMQSAQQRSLPGVFPPFNYEGVFKEIVEQAQRVEMLKSEYDAAKSEASDAKKSLDKGAELLMRMTLEFERRRKEKPDEDGTVETAVIEGCTWTSKHPGQQCPLCSKTVNETVIAEILGQPITAPNAQEHVDEVQKLLTGIAVDECEDALDNIDTFIDRQIIGEWSEQERETVQAYAKLQRAALDGNLDTPTATVTIERPAGLGKPHIPAACVDGEHQVCQFCEVVIRPASDTEAPFKETDYVGIDCKGKPDAGHRYPSNKGKKTAAKKISPQPKPSAKAKARKQK